MHKNRLTYDFYSTKHLRGNINNEVDLCLTITEEKAIV